MESNMIVKLGKVKNGTDYCFTIISEMEVKPSKPFLNRIFNILKKTIGSVILPIHDVNNFEYYSDIIELDIIKGEILRWSILDQP